MADKDHTFGPADLPEPCHQIKLCCPKQCRYHNRSKHRNRQILNKSRSTQQKYDHGKSCHKRGKLCLSLILLTHRCTGYGAIDRTAPGKGCKKISDGECKDLLIIINSVAIFLCKIILRQQRLRHNYNCHDRLTVTASRIETAEKSGICHCGSPVSTFESVWIPSSRTFPTRV